MVLVVPELVALLELVAREPGLEQALVLVPELGQALVLVPEPELGQEKGKDREKEKGKDRAKEKAQGMGQVQALDSQRHRCGQFGWQHQSPPR